MGRIFILAAKLVIAPFILSACNSAETLTPFSSDGCSLFPDSSLINNADWCECCIEHDIAYWKGGTMDQRKQADLKLKHCVMEKTDDAILAGLMYEGVRLGGSPYFYNWYRWGYGWSYDRKYKPLTGAEQDQARALLSDYHADSNAVCK